MNTLASIGYTPSTIGFNSTSNAASLAPLQNFQKTIPSYFDTSGIANSTNQLNTNTLTSGTQAANAAGRSYSQAALAQGGSPGLGGVAAAQALMPVYQQLGENTQSLNQQKLQASEQEGSLAGQVATSLSSLQNNYLQSLMGYNANIQGQNQGAQSAAAQRALGYSEFSQTLPIQQEQANTAAAAQRSNQQLGALQLLTQLPNPSATSTPFTPNWNPTPGQSVYQHSGLQPQSNPYSNNSNLNTIRNTIYGLI